MSFQISLQKNTSPPNKVDKEPTDVAYATGVLKDGASILDPVILIDSSLSSDIISNINYAYIAEFGRYYYITNIMSVTNQLWEIHMHVDVLMTYKTQIRNQSAIICRQEKKYNMLLDDGWFSCFQDPIVKRIRFTDSGGNPTQPFEAQEYVLVVAGS